MLLAGEPVRRARLAGGAPELPFPATTTTLTRAPVHGAIAYTVHRRFSSPSPSWCALRACQFIVASPVPWPRSACKIARAAGNRRGKPHIFHCERAPGAARVLAFLRFSRGSHRFLTPSRQFSLSLSPERHAAAARSLAVAECGVGVGPRRALLPTPTERARRLDCAVVFVGLSLRCCPPGGTVQVDLL